MFNFLRAPYFIIVLFFLSINIASAQTSASPDTSQVWDFGGLGTVNFSQVSLNNWAAGGQNSLSVLSIANIHADYKHGRNTWNTALDLTYGLVKLENQRMRKSDDKLELNVKYGYQASKRWYYSAQLNTKTQLTPTYSIPGDSLISNFFSPAAVLASIGMDYKPNENFSVFISPVTGKFTIVANQQLADKGAFGVRPARHDAAGELIPGTGRHLRSELGGYVNVRLKREILQNVTLQSKLDLFTNYLQNPQNVDVNWENLVNFKVNKYISASLFIHMIYDDNVDVDLDRNKDGVTDGKGPRLQVKETLGIGLSYKFD